MTDPVAEAPVTETVAVPTERVRRFRNDTDASIAWNGHAIAPHQDVEFFGPNGDLDLAAGITETTDIARFPLPPPPVAAPAPVVADEPDSNPLPPPVDE